VPRRFHLASTMDINPARLTRRREACGRGERLPFRIQNAAHMHHPYCTVSPLATQWLHGLCPGAGGPICPGISCAPSAFNLSNVLFLWYSITLLFLKYVTCPTISFITIVASQLCAVSAASSPSFCSATGQNVPSYSHNSSRILALPLSMPYPLYPFP
jgi:hypothetical protein